MKKYAPILLLSSLLVCTPATFAALIDHGSFLEDTVRDKYWLKLSETVGLSYVDVIAMTDLGGALEGWTLATWNQARDMYQRYFGLDLEGADFSPTPAELSKISILNSYMGDLMIDHGLPGQYSGSVGFITGGNAVHTYFYNYGANMADTSKPTNVNNRYSYAGALLIRSDLPAIPVPASFWLFGSGILGLMALTKIFTQEIRVL